VHPAVLSIDAVDGSARAGTVTVSGGAYTTPLFMPVGTRGTIKYLSAADYERVGAQVVLGNTYHLMLRPGADVVERFGGLGAFSGWDGLTLTDSGGFQVFSLDPDERRTSDPTSRCSGSSRAAPTPRCASRAPGAPSRWASTATPSVACRSARPGTRCCRRWRRRSSTCPPIGPAT
jgi:hypothetical protein